jgi:hypothetical protein
MRDKGIHNGIETALGALADADDEQRHAASHGGNPDQRWQRQLSCAALTRPVSTMVGPEWQAWLYTWHVRAARTRLLLHRLLSVRL